MLIRPICCVSVALMTALQLVSDVHGQGRLKPAPTALLDQGRLKSAPTASAPTSVALPRIVFLGDSLTAGYGLAKKSESVPSLIQARLDTAGYHYEVINAGVSGDTSAGGLSRLNWSLDGDVKVLVIELGANDGLRGLPVAAMKHNLDQIITRAKARGITVLLTGMEAPPNYGAAYTTEFRAVFADLAREHKLAFVPFYLQGVAGIPSLNISDGMHPNASGTRIVEATIWRALEPLLAKPR
jgi:acyl-CoA thioesterase-1